jgi:hypothetical protein
MRWHAEQPESESAAESTGSLQWKNGPAPLAPSEDAASDAQGHLACRHDTARLNTRAGHRICTTAASLRFPQLQLCVQRRVYSV